MKDLHNRLQTVQQELNTLLREMESLEFTCKDLNQEIQKPNVKIELLKDLIHILKVATKLFSVILSLEEQ